MEVKKKTKRIPLDNASNTSFGQRIVRYFQDSSKLLVAGVIVIAGSVFAVGLRQNFREKRELRAKQLVWPLEAYIREGAYDQALEGGGGDMGLLEFVEKFGNTKAGNLARLYAAVAYLEKECPDKEAAIKHLKAFNCPDTFMQFRVWGWLGDIYCDQDHKLAIAFYDKAANHIPNRFTTPDYLIKAAMVCEVMMEYERARKYYERVYTLFPKCRRAQEAMKHESRLRQLLNN